MRSVRSTAFLFCIAACGGYGAKHTSYRASGYPPSQAQVAGDPQTAGNTSVHHGVNPWVDTAKDNLSTFAADVDTASYTLSRRSLQGGELPPAAAVRVEEYVNYFHYAFPQPAQGSPFSVVMDAASVLLPRSTTGEPADSL